MEWPSCFTRKELKVNSPVLKKCSTYQSEHVNCSYRQQLFDQYIVANTALLKEVWCQLTPICQKLQDLLKNGLI